MLGRGGKERLPCRHPRLENRETWGARGGTFWLGRVRGSSRDLRLGRSQRPRTRVSAPHEPAITLGGAGLVLTRGFGSGKMAGVRACGENSERFQGYCKPRLVSGRARLHNLRKNSKMCGSPWKSGPSGPRKPSEINAGFSPGGIVGGEANSKCENVWDYTIGENVLIHKLWRGKL